MMAGIGFTFYEFFAGGGMVRAGLDNGNWDCLFANDFDRKKCESYARNWGSDTLVCDDVAALQTFDLPSRANLVWASFPCQDLSLAGGGAGLGGDRSGTFWPFWRLMDALIADGRAPDILALENVSGTLTSHGGKDFEAICRSFVKSGYRVGAVVVDAALFVPHSRPRLFVVGVREGVAIPRGLIGDGASAQWHPKALRTAYDRLPSACKDFWLWWRIAPPALSDIRFADLIEETPVSVKWHSEIETQKLLSMMSTINLAKVHYAQRAGLKMVGTIYKRTRHDALGQKVQRAEVRFDDIAGCLRTPGGGSSRQTILVVDGNTVKSRLISTRETARLMGLPEDYCLPENYNEAYHLTGDGVVAPVVRHLAEQLFEPLLQATKWRRAVA
ncbi:DNA cytosine methyltransferase [Sphingorhabdus sp.]|uniref:DNA cytosine methyltransferase n=1 Tax=Sphingorhabdus sp. TaxID=1902408 RepID=UPI0025FE7CA9|nr:DNA cytosine methyltransferase [Sphingorhabdus sp.]